MERVTLLIGGDVVPTEPNMSLFREGRIGEAMGGTLFREWLEADIRVFNLETPLTDRDTPIPKAGPNLRAPREAMKGLAQMQPTVVGTANNHIMDQGAPGWADTMEALREQGLKMIGSGERLGRTGGSILLEKKGRKIGLYACAEHEFSIAGEHEPGAEPFDETGSREAIRALRERADFVSVLYHGGKEQYRYPSPELQKRCRGMIEAGADLVVCQHSHCIGCEEKYGGGTIVYGQGNFLFLKRDNEYWKTSLLVRAELGDGKPEISYIPLKQKHPGIEKAEGRDAEEMLKAFRERSRQIQEEGFIGKHYAELARMNRNDLLRRFDLISSTALYRVINRATGKRLDRWYFGKVYRKKKYAMRNAVECETWNELLREALKGD